jgi:hypothetical protein
MANKCEKFKKKGLSLCALTLWLGARAVLCIMRHSFAFDVIVFINAYIL